MNACSDIVRMSSAGTCTVCPAVAIQRPGHGIGGIGIEGGGRIEQPVGAAGVGRSAEGGRDGMIGVVDTISFVFFLVFLMY